MRIGVLPSFGLIIQAIFSKKFLEIASEICHFLFCGMTEICRFLSSGILLMTKAEKFTSFGEMLTTKRGLFMSRGLIRMTRTCSLLSFGLNFMVFGFVINNNKI